MSEPEEIFPVSTLFSTDSNNNNDNEIEGIEPTKIKHKKLISIGNCSRFYFYILGAIIFILISLFILGIKESGVGLFGFVPILNSYTSMQSIYTYLGHIIFGLILHFYSKGRKKDDKKFLTESLTLVYNKLMKKNQTKTYFTLFFTCFCFAIYNETQNLLALFRFHDLDFWSFDILFTFLLMKKYFEFDIKKHHKCSIIFVIIICTVLLIIISFLPNPESDYLNQYEFAKDQLGSYFYSFIFIFIFLILSIIYSFSRNFAKVLIQSKFVSIDSLIVFIGVAGLILTIIISIITYFYEKDNFISYFEELKTQNTWEILRDVLIVAPIYLFSQFMQIYFEILIIYYLNPIYTLMLNNINFGISRLITFLFDINMEYLANFILSEISEIIAIIGYIINLEILELNFCGLSDNLRRNIMNKAHQEFLNLNKENNKLKLDINENEYMGIEKYREMNEQLNH